MEIEDVAYGFLKSCNIKIDKKYFAYLIKSNPFYPSLLSLTDALDELDISYLATQIGFEELAEIQFPIFSYFVTNDTGKFLYYTSLKKFEESPYFRKEIWSGYVLIVPAGQVIESARHNLIQNRNRIYRIASYIIISGFLILNFISINISKNIVLLIYNFFSVVGIYLCTLIIMKVSGINSSITEKYCNSKTDDCDKVLKSKAAKIFDDLSLGDLGLMYFTTTYLYLLLSFLNNSGLALFGILAICSLVSGVLSFLSIWYQVFRMRSWCRLCLLVILVLWIQIGVVIWNYIENGNIKFLLLEGLNGIYLFLFCLLISSLWIFIKRELTARVKYENESIKYNRWRRNSETFKVALSSERKVELSTGYEQIKIGNDTSLSKIIMVCNPYCAPCSEMHTKIDSLLEQMENDVTVIFIFLIQKPEMESRHKVALNSVLNAFFNQGIRDKRKIISDWFENMDLSEWKKNYPLLDDIDYTNIFIKHQKWCEKYEVNLTPTLFFNGSKVPDNYEVEDLRYFLSASRGRNWTDSK